jgi:ABC-type sugar transport system ATPase subunit
MSDRLLVMSRGEVVCEFHQPNLPSENILRAAFGQTEAVR